MENPKYYFPLWKKRSIDRYCEIKATSSYLPEKTISNDDIINKYGLPYKSSAIVKSYGVELRHTAEDNTSDSDILRVAAQSCLTASNLKPDDLSRLIVNKFYGDNILPMTASILQRKLGSNTAVHAFDIDGGITSFLHSVDAVSRYIATGDDYILLTSGGITSRLISKTDPRVAFLFGDGAASILFGYSEEPHILASYFYSNYEYYELATAITPITLVDKRDSLDIMQQMALVYDTYYMDNWKIAEEFLRQAVMVLSENLFMESGLTAKDIDLVLVTENNCKVRELTLEVLGMSEDKSLTLLRDHGNTMSAMLPMLIDYGFAKGRICKGMNLMLISHGEGLSGGGMIYRV
jgi:3-oxoacyl-[acyl-carrier-protein] synthase-3